MPELEEWQNANPLRIWRESVQQTKSGVAAMLGISANTVRSWERGYGEPTRLNKDAISALSDAAVTADDWATWYAKRPNRITV